MLNISDIEEQFKSDIQELMKQKVDLDYLKNINSKLDDIEEKEKNIKKEKELYLSILEDYIKVVSQPSREAYII